MVLLLSVLIHNANLIPVFIHIFCCSSRASSSIVFYPAESWNIDLVPGSISCLRLFRICYRFGRFFYRFMIHRNRRGILLCTIRFLCWICQDLLAWRFWFGWFRLDTLRCLISLWRPPGRTSLPDGFEPNCIPMAAIRPIPMSTPPKIARFFFIFSVSFIILLLLYPVLLCTTYYTILSKSRSFPRTPLYIQPVPSM